MQAISIVRRLLQGITSSNEDDPSPFGELGDPHSNLMVYAWCPVVDVAIFFALYSYRRYALIVHGMLGMAVGLFALITGFSILSNTGIIYSDSTINTDIEITKLSRHYTIGIICLSLIIVTILLGFFSRLFNILGFSSRKIIGVRIIHKIIGYIIAILCKIQAYLIYDSTEDDILWIMLGIDCFLILFLILRKIFFPQIKSTISPKYEMKLMEIKSLAALSVKDYTIFANYVYQLGPLKWDHPGGYQIIEAIKNRDSDRFMYGMYGPEELPEILTHSHSYKSLQLLGDPVAKIVIDDVVTGFNNDEAEVYLDGLKAFSEDLFQAKLYKKQGQFLQGKYTNIYQIGRFRSLTLNGKVTRLYTNLVFLHTANVEFLINRYFNKRGIDIPFLSQVHFNSSRPVHQMEQIHTMDRINTVSFTFIPLLFKKYPMGQLTPLIGSDKSKLILSISKGEGLKINEWKQGKIILLAGGTGLYPFCDLIDLLFKQKLQLQEPRLKDQIIELSPVLQTEPFRKFSFHLILAIRSVKDIHPITLFQLLFLTSNSTNFEMTLKISKNDLPELGQSKIRFSEQRFDVLVEQEIVKNNVSKVLICGPPNMNSSVSLALKRKYSRDLYIIV